MINVDEKPIVSVIIPCYNQGRYLSKAIESVLSQSFFNFEIVVVDDGSSDHTKQVAQQYDTVKYVYQVNQGLSSARNTGIDYSLGKYLVFLDSDDWLLPDALITNLNFIRLNPEAAFVAGGHRFFYDKDKTTQDVAKEIEYDHYCNLLQSNFIAMIASVMFQRWVFDKFRYDTKLKVCEDYDIYLKVAREYPITHHKEVIAVYFIHNVNMSKDAPLMLKTALQILDLQKPVLRDNKDRNYYERGQAFWKNWYCGVIYEELNVVLQESYNNNSQNLKTLRKYNKKLFFKLIIKAAFILFKTLLK